MQVEFTDPAEESLRKIYCRYPEEIAEKIVGQILGRAEKLSTLVSRGRIVEELRSLNQGHRFILEGNYKIIYLQQEDIVYVTDVFDMGQDPGRIRQRHQE
ncbi:MAG: type II toxin-antitoxin system RelE/ParE family toxin [Cyclobacteriaceae bacterium]